MVITKKIGILCSGLVLASVAIAGLSYRSARSLNATMSTLVEDSLPGLDRISTVNSGVRDLRVNLWRFIAVSDPSVRSTLSAEAQEIERLVQSTLAAYEGTITTDVDRNLFRQASGALDTYTRTIRQVRSFIQEGKKEEAMRLLDETGTPAFGALASVLDQLVKNNRENSVAATSEAHAESNFATVASMMMVVLALIGGAAASATLIRNIDKTLRGVTEELRAAATQMVAASAQIAQSSKTLAEDASEQAAAVEETSASTEEINAITQKSRDQAERAQELMRQAGQIVGRADAAFGEMVASMEAISSSSHHVQQIIKVIDEIAFQTNILALNAAVEAARAGDAGMGFAVVADEVRTLAQRSAKAAKETEALIAESATNTASGKQKLDEVVVAMADNSSLAGRVAVIVSELKSSSDEQARGTEQISAAIGQVDQVTQRTAANAEEAAAAAEELNAQAESLRDILRTLSALIDARDAIHTNA